MGDAAVNKPASVARYFPSRLSWVYELVELCGALIKFEATVLRILATPNRQRLLVSYRICITRRNLRRAQLLGHPKMIPFLRSCGRPISWASRVPSNARPKSRSEPADRSLWIWCLADGFVGRESSSWAHQRFLTIRNHHKPSFSRS